MTIHVKIGVTCDDHQHEGENPEVTLNAELTTDGLVKLVNQEGWQFAKARYDPTIEATCGACVMATISARHQSPYIRKKR